MEAKLSERVAAFEARVEKARRDAKSELERWKAIVVEKWEHLKSAVDATVQELKLGLDRFSKKS